MFKLARGLKTLSTLRPPKLTLSPSLPNRETLSKSPAFSHSKKLKSTRTRANCRPYAPPPCPASPRSLIGDPPPLHKRASINITRPQFLRRRPLTIFFFLISRPSASTAKPWLLISPQTVITRHLRWGLLNLLGPVSHCPAHQVRSNN